MLLGTGVPVEKLIWVGSTQKPSASGRPINDVLDFGDISGLVTKIGVDFRHLRRKRSFSTGTDLTVNLFRQLWIDYEMANIPPSIWIDGRVEGISQQLRNELGHFVLVGQGGQSVLP
jgi:hypothetical protein